MSVERKHKDKLKKVEALQRLFEWKEEAYALCRFSKGR